MFVDEKTLSISAGKGGDGVALFRREIYVPRGGPDGGDGGKGGDVLIVGKHNMHALTHLTHLDRIKAEDGKKGGHKQSSGKGGENEIVEVPLGTVIEEEVDGTWTKIGEILDDGQSMLVAKGGNGGWGNWHFKSSIQQTPDRWNPGLEGDKKKLRLVLKMIADIGLVGFPNAGKSTFLSVVSAARPKIANYPFTTLEPQLGVTALKVGKETINLVIADLPGLIEGASEGKGLGTTFLKHVERTKTILHFIDATQSDEELIAAYRTIRKELEAWSSELSTKPESIVLTKTDLLPPEEIVEKQSMLEKELGKKVYAISAQTRTGIDDLLKRVAQ